MNRRRAWALAARVPTLPAAVAPVVVGSAAAAHDGRFEWIGAAGALIVSLAIQIGTNFSNDAFDFLRGADTARRLGPPRVTQAGLLPARAVLNGAYVCFVLAAAVGAYFVAQYGWPILIAGLLSIASGLAYTAGPWPIAYHALGELFVFVFFGLVAVAGTTFVQTGHVTPLALGAAVPVGLLCTAILIVNNLRDIETDRAAGKRTLAVLLGPGSTRVLYLACLAAAAVSPAILRAAGHVGPHFWLPWLTLPMMVALAHTVRPGADAAALNRALKGTARLHLIFALLLAASLL
jgi:1,4-dihydroxy-2-naphthoate octaprenyltransferase